MRKITVDGQHWRYKIGSRFAKLVPPSGPSSCVPLSRLTGVDADTFERARRGGHKWGMVTPEMVSRYIRQNGA